MEKQQIYVYGTLVDDDYDDDDEIEMSRELLRELEELHSCSEIFSTLVANQQQDVDLVENNFDYSANLIAVGNSELIKAGESHSIGTRLQGSIGGLLTGAGTGGVVSFFIGQALIIPGLLIGGVGGTVLGLTVSDGITCYINDKLKKIISINQSKVIQSKVIQSKAKQSQSNIKNFENNNFFIQSKAKQSQSIQTNQTQTNQTQTNLYNCLQKLLETNQTLECGYLQLIKQGEQIDTTVKSLENIQQELELTGVLKGRFNSNTLSYFVKLLFLSTDRGTHVNKIMTEINSVLDASGNNNYQSLISVSSFKLPFLPLSVPIITPNIISNISSTREHISESPILQIKNRYSSLPFRNLTELDNYDDFLILQKLRQSGQYRVIAVDREQPSKCIRVYLFHAESDCEGVEIFKKYCYLIATIFSGFSYSDIFKILQILPDVKGFERCLDATDILVNDIRVILKREVMPKIINIDKELTRQEAVLSIIDKELSKTKV